MEIIFKSSCRCGEILPWDRSSSSRYKSNVIKLNIAIKFITFEQWAWRNFKISRFWDQQNIFRLNIDDQLRNSCLYGSWNLGRKRLQLKSGYLVYWSFNVLFAIRRISVFEWRKLTRPKDREWRGKLSRLSMECYLIER